MICDLCKEHSDRIIRVNSWQVCQWCVSNNVLGHALEVEFDIGELREAVAESSARHRRNVRKEKVAETKRERAYAAYADLTTAMQDLATSTANSKESLKLELAAEKALEEFKDKGQRKTDKARKILRPSICLRV